MNCSKCGGVLEEDPDGYWCPICEEYWDRVDIEEYIQEQE